MPCNHLYNAIHRSLLALPLVSLSFFATFAGAAQPAVTPPVNPIVNQARASYDRSGTERDDSSNEIVTTVRSVVIDLQKTASPSRAGVGDTLTYHLRVTNLPESVPVQTLHLVDTLPAALRYVPGSARAENSDGEPVAVDTVVENQVGGSTLRWTLPDLAPGDVVTVVFQATVLPTVLFEKDIVNEAQALVADGAGLELASVASSATTPVELGLFEQRAVLLGTAFVDANMNGRYDPAADAVVPNLRLYLSDGSEAVTDELGRYTFQNVEPSLVALRVDTTTTPARLFEATVSEDKPGLWRVRLLPGVVTRRDVPFKAARLELSVRQRLNVVMGPLELEKRVEAVPGGVMVTLSVSASEALRGVVVREALADGATLLEAPVFEGGTPVAGAGLELALGDVPAGYRQVLSYKVAYSDASEKLLTAPDIRWDVR